VIFITQNLFHQGGQHRTRNLNVQYLVLFKNPRDQTVIDFLSRQAFPANRRFLIDVFADATKDPYGYLFMDFTQTCPYELRIRSNIFNDTIVYKQNRLVIYVNHEIQEIYRETRKRVKNKKGEKGEKGEKGS